MLVGYITAIKLSVETPLAWSANLGLRSVFGVYGIKKHVFLTPHFLT
jgi:hypothetical protein